VSIPRSTARSAFSSGGSERSRNGDGVTFSEWFVCRGRISRRTWWLRYALPILGLSVLAALADASLGYPLVTIAPDSGAVDYLSGPMSGLVSLLTLVPSISSTVARLHDRGHSAWWLLWFLLPLVGVIVLLVQNAFLRGDGGPNRYGPAPGAPAPLSFAG
jgi:uncharacterized membrane protein YhaH (DUF805 family)